MLGYGKDLHSYRVFNLFHYEVPCSESIKLMGTGEIIPSEAQPEEELIISAPEQPEDNAQPKDNPSNDDNDQQEQNLRPAHPHFANEVQIEK